MVFCRQQASIVPPAKDLFEVDDNVVEVRRHQDYTPEGNLPPHHRRARSLSSGIGDLPPQSSEGLTDMDITMGSDEDNVQNKPVVQTKVRITLNHFCYSDHNFLFFQ